jgi:hypothetical protein
MADGMVELEEARDQVIQPNRYLHGEWAPPILEDDQISYVMDRTIGPTHTPVQIPDGDALEAEPMR